MKITFNPMVNATLFQDILGTTTDGSWVLVLGLTQWSILVELWDL